MFIGNWHTFSFGVESVVMFSSPIVFIIGAGASCEAELPAGEKLKSELESKLNIKFDIFEFDSTRPKTGDSVIWEAIRQHGIQSQAHNVSLEPCRLAAVRISEGLSLDSSIDHFLDKHRGDEKIELCGKLGIAKCILEAESQSKLY